MVREIVDPINELRRIASLLAHDDLSSAVPTNSSSLDMKILLDAFSKLVVALRFGNENYSRGNLAIARSVYDDALKLFSNTGNVKGLGACHNNLGAVELSSASFAKSENHYNRAIEYCEKAILDSKSPEETKRLRRTLSDRKGNLAVLYLDRKDILSNNLTIAFDMIEKLLIEDKKRCTLIFFLFSAHSHFFIFIAGIYEDV
jgi:tetratricopeptide (TPR) repeat protein